MLKKLSYLYEIPLFYLFTLGVNRVVASSMPGFFGVDPHPFWIGILIFSIRYGVLAGLLSGITSAAAYFGIAWYTLEPYLFEDLSFYILPSCFILFGALIGAISSSYRDRLKDSQQETDRLERIIDDFKDEVKTVKEINLGLEKKIVSRMTTLVTLYEGARRLEVSDVEDLYASILDFISKTLGAEQSSLYLKSGSQWKLKHQLGWQNFEKHPEEFNYQEGLTGLAGSQVKVLSIRDFIKSDNAAFVQEGPQLLGDAILAGPIRRGEEGEVLGVVSIQKMPFLLFNSASMSLFTFLLHWASRSLGRAYQLSAMKDQEILDSDYHIYSKNYFQMRGLQEFDRSRTYYLPLSLGVVKVKGVSTLDPRSRNRLLVLISELLKTEIRSMDVFARFQDHKDYPFAFILVTASKVQAEEMREKMLSALQKVDLKTVGNVAVDIGLSSFTPETKEWDQLVNQACVSL